MGPPFSFVGEPVPSNRSQQLSIRLSVEDADTARAALIAFGKEGEKALGAIERASKPASAGLNLMDLASGRVTSGMSKLRTALIAAAGPAALVALAKRSLEASDALVTAADKAGVSIKAFQELGYAASSNASSAESMSQGLVNLTKRIGDAAAGSGDLRDIMRQYGVSVKDAEGHTRSTEDVIGDLADVIKNTSSQAERLRISSAAFGRDLGQELLPALSQGRDGFKAAAKEAQGFGLILDDTVARNAAEAKDSLERLNTVLSVQSTKAFANLAPVIEQVANGLAKVAGEQLSDVGYKLQRLFVDLPHMSSDALEKMLQQSDTAIGELVDKRADLEKKLAAVPADKGGTTGGLPSRYFSQDRQEAERQRKELAAELQKQNDLIASYAQGRRQIIDEMARREAEDDERKKKRADDEARALSEQQKREQEAARAKLAEVVGSAQGVSSPLAQALVAMKKQVAELEALADKGSLSAEQLATGRAAALSAFLAKGGEQMRAAAQEFKKTSDELDKKNEDRTWADAEAASGVLSPIAKARLEMRKNIAELNRDYKKGDMDAAQYHQRLVAQSAAFQAVLDQQAAEAQEKTFGAKAKQEAADYFQLLSDAGGRAGGFLVGQIRNMEDALADFFEHGKFNAANFFDAIKATVARTLAQDVTSGIGGILGLSQGSTVTGSFLGGIFGGAGSAIGSSISGAAKSAGSWLSDIGSGIADFFGFADGGSPGDGLVRGPGTPRSDSINAKLSVDEFVMNAAATRRYLPVLRQMNANGRRSFASAGGRRGFADGGDMSGGGGMSHDNDATENEKSTYGNDYGTDSNPGNGSYTYNDGFFGNSWSYDNPDTGNHLDGLKTGETVGRASPTGLQNVTNRQGQVVDRVGGTLSERIGTFFGVGTEYGFLGSPAAGILASVLGSLIGGPLGMVAGFSMNLGREALTGGAARQAAGGGLTDALGDRMFGPGVTTPQNALDRALDRIGERLGIDTSAATQPGRSLPGEPSSIERAGSPTGPDNSGALLIELQALRRDLALDRNSLGRLIVSGSTLRRTDVF